MFRMIAIALAGIALSSTVADRAEAGLTKGRINETGQTTSWGPGSDGDLRRGLTRSFVDFGNGVIKDRRTGLSWEKKSDDGSIHDQDNTYTWSKDGFALMDGTMVSTFLAALNTPPCFGASAENPAGFCDWRIPNLAELESIRNLEPVFLSTFPEFASGCTPGCSVTTCSCTASSYYWTTSTRRFYSGKAWYVDFGGGAEDSYDKTVGQAVRAVRGGF